MSRTVSMIAALSGLLVAGFAHAADVGQHPAVFSPRALPAIDANTFIVAHPAGPSFQAARVLEDHPAVQARAVARGIDSDRFLVQPPASTRWTTSPDAVVFTAAGAMPAQR